MPGVRRQRSRSNKPEAPRGDDDLREVLSAGLRALESADNALAAPKIADYRVARQKIKQARDRINKYWTQARL